MTTVSSISTSVVYTHMHTHIHTACANTHDEVHTHTQQKHGDKEKKIESLNIKLMPQMKINTQQKTNNRNFENKLWKKMQKDGRK